METIIAGVFIIAYMFFTIYIANIAYQQGGDHQQEGLIRTVLFATPMLLGLLGLFVIFYALSIAQMGNLSEQELQTQFNISEVPNFPPSTALLSLFICGVTSLFTFKLITSPALRHKFQQVIQNWGKGKFQAASIVHLTAIMFIILFLTLNTVLYLLNGASIDTSEIQISEVVLEGAIRIVVAFLGVGYAIRRTLPQTLHRLGLRSPTRDDVWSALIAVVGLMILILIFSIIVGIFVSESTIEEQTSNANELAEVFSTSLLVVIVISLTAALSEEILIRGALQPIFGLIPTSIFFALLHTQVLLTSGIVIIFIVGLVFGLLRQRYSTSSAIIAHFVYNFLILTFA